ncbi:MAG TPA: hypothetical protein VHC43_15440 [Mycobacteriales bacterium]|nr:hypothetical protein [Mycobacteriales bacterium]
MGSNPAIPTNGTGGRVVTVLGAETAVGEAILTRIGPEFSAVAARDEDPIPTGTTAVIDAGPLRQPPILGDLISLSADGWRQSAEDPLGRALHVLQRAHLSLRDEGGRIVVLLPSVVMTGAPGAAAWAAAAEGYRSLAKAAARAWGSEGIAIQCVLVAAGGDRPGLQPPALSRAPDSTDIAAAIAALLDARLDLVTGLTLAIDGGVWMTP